jgi:hypothetical protein
MRGTICKANIQQAHGPFSLEMYDHPKTQRRRFEQYWKHAVVFWYGRCELVLCCTLWTSNIKLLNSCMNWKPMWECQSRQVQTHIGMEGADLLEMINSCEASVTIGPRYMNVLLFWLTLWEYKLVYCKLLLLWVSNCKWQ